MKIFKQLDINDCGISVTQSLIHHYYKKTIEKTELYEKCNISKSGISILDLERLNSIYGIELESYEASFQDFKEYRTKDYFILLLNYNNFSHYVIAKKSKNYVTIYDSEKGKFQLSYDELMPLYQNIFISFQQNKKINFIYKKIWKKELPINYFNLFIVFSINFLLLGSTITAGYFIKSIFNNVIPNSDLANLGVIIFVSLFAYATINFGNFIISYFETKQKNIYQKQLSDIFINSIFDKNNSFFYKMTEHQLLMNQFHIKNISTFFSHYINLIVTNSFNLFLFLTFVLFIEWKILVLVGLSILLNLGYSYFSYLINKKSFPKVTKIQNEQKRLYFILEKFLVDENNTDKLANIGYWIKKNILNEVLLDNNVSLTNNIFQKCNSFLFNIINLSLYGLGAYLLFLNEINIGDLILVTTFYSYINKSVSEIIDFFFFRINYNYSYKIFFHLINTNNNLNEGVNWTIPKIIHLKDLSFYYEGKKIINKLNLNLKNMTFISGQSGSGKTTLYKLLINKIKPNLGSIFFDQFEQNKINQNQFNKSIIYQNSKSFLGNYTWNEILESIPEKLRFNVINTAHKLNIDIKDNLSENVFSSGQLQYMNILKLLKYKNKFIILDEALCHIDSKYKQFVFENLIKFLSLNNFVLCSEHDLNTSKYFNHLIKIDPKSGWKYEAII